VSDDINEMQPKPIDTTVGNFVKKPEKDLQ